MEVLVEKQPACLATLRVTIPSAMVKTKLENLAQKFRKEAKLPGFRPGKAPLAMVVRKYKESLAGEVTEAFVHEAVKKAEKDNNFLVINAYDLKHGEVGDKDLEMTVQLTLEPEFVLPDFESLNLEIVEEVVTEVDVENSIKRLLDTMAGFKDVNDRALQMEDYAVLTYSATMEGKPLEEVHPDVSPFLLSGVKFWVLMAEHSFWPGFCEKLVGMKEGEERSVEIEVAGDAEVEVLRGKKLTYHVKLDGIKGKDVPEFTDEIAHKLLNRNAEEARQFIRENLEVNAKIKTEESKQAVVMEHLVKSIEFEVPEEIVVNETRRMMSEIVESEHKSGRNDEEILSQKDAILQHSQIGGQFRTRTDFILARVAREQKIEATGDEIIAYLTNIAARMDTSVERLAKKLSKNDGITRASRTVVRGKALDFLTSKVKVKKPEDKV